MIYRSLLLSLTLFFSFSGLYAQNLPARFKDLPAQQKVLLTETGLREKTDSLQAYSRIDVYGVFKELDLSLNEAYLQQNTSRQNFTWHILHPQLSSRIYATINNLTEEDTVYIMNARGYLIESISLENLPGSVYTGIPVAEEQFIQLSRSSSSKADLHIYGMSLEPRLPHFKQKAADFGNSGPCQVNVNCSEGNNFSDIKNSVVRILVKLGPSLGFCTGSIVNTANYSYAPYLITAEHCGIISPGNYVSAADLNSWTFYFNYQSDNCTSPPSEGNLAQQRITGARLLANSDDNGGDLGSDFFLLELNTNIPAAFNAYYIGWNRKGDDTPLNGASIHHPNGDLKKISVYSSPASSGSFDGRVSGTHWVVNWIPTVNGFGTTEAGSSGCPLYDEDGLLRGVLTGGAAACSSPNGLDYFGKFSYSWAGNGNIPERRLRDWLDPGGTGYLAINGSYFGDSVPVSSDEDLFIVNNPVTDGVLAIENIGDPTDDLQVLVTDLSGKVVYNRQTVSIPGTNQKIATGNWRNGLYIIVVLRNKEVITRKAFIRN